MTDKEKKELFEKLQNHVSQFHEESAELSTTLKKVVDDLDKGKLLKSEQCTDAVGKITSVKALRKLCEKTYKEFGQNDLPETFDEFSAEVTRIEAMFDKSEYVEARDFLLRLNAHDENIRVLFNELKRELLDIDIDILNVDECRSVMGKYLDLKNMLTADPSDKAGYMVRIANDFDESILSLAFTNAYTLDDGLNVDAIEDSDDIPVTQGDVFSDDDTADEDDYYDVAATSEDALEETVSEEKEDVVFDSADTVSDEESRGDVLLDESEGIEDVYDEEDEENFIELLYGSNIDDLIDEFGFEFCDYEGLKLEVAESPQAKKAFSIKKLKEEIRGKAFGRSVMWMMNLFSMYRFMKYEGDEDFARQSLDIYHSDKESYDYHECLDFLQKKGYIKYLRADGGPTLAVLSSKGAEMLCNKSACEFLGVEVRAKGSYRAIPADAACYEAAIMKIRIYDILGECESFMDSVGLKAQITTDHAGKQTFVCAAVENALDLAGLLLMFAEISADEDIETLHVVQPTKEQAMALSGMLLRCSDVDIDADKTRVIIYYTDDSGVFANDVYSEGSSNNKQKKTKEDSAKTDDKLSQDETKAKPEKEKPAAKKKNTGEKETKKAKSKSGQASSAPVKEVKEKSPLKAEKESPAAAKKSIDLLDSVENKIERFINDNKLFCAAAYAGAAAHKHPEAEPLYKRLAYAINDPAAGCTYTSENLFSIYTDFAHQSDYCYQVSAVLRLFFAGQSRFDYNLQAIHDSIKGSPALDDNPALNDLIYNLRQFKTKSGYSIDKYADYRSHDRVELEKELKTLARDASAFYENDFIQQRMMYTKTINRRYEATWRAIFSKDSDFGSFVKAVAENDTEIIELARDFVDETFIKEGMPVSADNIDPRKIDELMDTEWNSVDISDKVALVMKSTNLMGAMRNNFRQHILKSASAIASWVEVHEALGDGKDAGYEAYAAIKGKLISLADDAAAALEKKMEEADDSLKAGLMVVIRTIKEIKAKLDGTYNMADQKYFYRDLLTHNYVILGEDYMPDFDCTVPMITEMDMMRLVEKHAAAEEQSLEQNLGNYCGDNYGSARLIIDYLSAATGKAPEIATTVSEAEKYAEGQLGLAHKDFISDLELAQSYGQLDADDAEDKKDSLLRVADKWFGWAEETHNFGFYKSLLEEMRLQIKADAAGRGETMNKELESILAGDKTLERDNAEYIGRIRKTIDKQNYLVAEDMLNHLLAGDIPHDVDLFEEDYLADFQKSYSYYFKLAGTSGHALANQVKTNDLKGLSSKDQKGALALKNSWPNPGRAVSAESLRMMLGALGFDVDKIALADPANSVFNVRIKKPLHEDEKSYGHPVYGFGSKAARDGFRVLWLSGAYNADALIAKCSELGKGKHTIAFLDYTLTDSERRRLARKIKEEGSSKIFAVIDRVLYMYLIHNYSETYISRMLHETMMPFAYFQPYVYDSATVMPPEMFMGRKSELEKIKDPAGVNIVYGGRQLGKSALLRKAMTDINGADDGEKAVLIDIKDLDYADTAKKISQTLLDEHIIDEPVSDESDWGELARAVKNTINGSKKVKYLLLMLDEADKFLESCEEVGYSPFNSLKDIQTGVESGRFKFVVAGLRNVVRFNKAASSGNSVIPHLEPLVIKPFTTQEARMLLEQPLYYLGFRFPEDNADLVPMILATANYFPGLIQFFGARLIEALKKNYGDYEEAVAPPYILEEGLIKRVLAESDFRNQIREKFMITLTVGDDEYYYILALILAYLYKNYDREDGYTAAEILNVAKELSTDKISEMSTDQIDALMTELTELNVMRMTSDNRYLFSRYSFLSMMGTSDEVDEKLLSYSV